MRTSGDTMSATGSPARTGPRSGPYTNPPLSRASIVRSLPTAATSACNSGLPDRGRVTLDPTSSQMQAAVASAPPAEDHATFGVPIDAHQLRAPPAPVTAAGSRVCALSLNTK